MGLLQRLFALARSPSIADSSPPPAIEPAAWPSLEIEGLRSAVVAAAMDLNRVARDSDGDLFDCPRATTALFAACDRLAAAWQRRCYGADPNAVSLDLERELPAGSA